MVKIKIRTKKYFGRFSALSKIENIISFFVHVVKVLFFDIGLGWSAFGGSEKKAGSGLMMVERPLRVMRRGAAQNEAEDKCYRTTVPLFLISPVFSK